MSRSMWQDETGAIGLLSTILLAIAVLGIVAVGWRVMVSVSKTEEANANASVVGATLRMYQGQDTSTPTEWVEYRNDKLGFTFKFPPSWGSARVATDTNDQFLLIFDSKPAGKPKNFNGEIRATSATAQTPPTNVARGYLLENNKYYRRADDKNNVDITSQVLSVMNTKSGKIVVYQDSSSKTSPPYLTALVNLKNDISFSGLNFTYGSNAEMSDMDEFKKVLQSFQYTN